YLSTYLPIYLSTYLPIYLSTYLPIYLSTYLPIYLSTYLPILSTYLPIYLSTYHSFFFFSLFFSLFLSFIYCSFSVLNLVSSLSYLVLLPSPYLLISLLPSLDVVAVSQAPSPESNPNSPLPVVA
ncbi:hypothetical protein BYT42DRAFT_541553, partial [Radiomyces spectabilis]